MPQHAPETTPANHLVPSLVGIALLSALAFSTWQLVLDDGVSAVPEPGSTIANADSCCRPASTVHAESGRSAEPQPRRFTQGWTVPRVVDVDGGLHQPGANPDVAALAFVFLAAECPISNGYLPELARLHERFGNEVEFYGVVADPFTTRREAAEHRSEYGIPFPVFLDTTHAFQRRLGATITPEVVVVDASGEIVYRGRIDDRYRDLARPRPEAETRDFELALTAVLDGSRPEVTETVAVGCRLPSPDRTGEAGAVTFCRDVAPIVFANCTECHREDGATPFALETYEDVRRRAGQIVEVVDRGLMPPWGPKADFGHFVNERRLTGDEIAVFRAWLDGGAERGDEADLPALPSFPSGWHLGPPDVVLEMPEPINVPADGPDLYQHFVIPTGLVEDTAVVAFEYQPGNPSVVHHSWLYFDDSGVARQLDADDPGPGYNRFGGPGFPPAANLGGWGPGGLPRELPEGTGRMIPAGSDLVLQVHYHPTGRAETDRSRVGLYFARERPTRFVIDIMVADVDIEIPAGESRYRFEASYQLPVETDLLDASPHMHLLGREMKVTATKPDGEVVPLIWIDDWNFYWQDHYVFEQPVRLPAGTRIDMVAWYDNSAGNPHNPHSPPRPARYGELSDDEMGICYFQATPAKPRDLVPLARHMSATFQAMMQRYERDQLRNRRPAAN